MSSERRTGMPLPKGLLKPTTPPEEISAERGGDAPSPEPVAREEAATQAEPKAPKTRKKRAPSTDKTEGRRLYLSQGGHFRLRMLAYQRKQKISEVAEDVLDKALPKWEVNRTG